MIDKANFPIWETIFMHFSADISFSFLWTFILQWACNFDNRKGNGTTYINKNFKRDLVVLCVSRPETTLTLSPHHTDKAEEWKTSSKSQLFPVEIRLRAPINGPIRLNYQPQWSALLAIRIYLPTTHSSNTLKNYSTARERVCDGWTTRVKNGIKESEKAMEDSERKERENMCHLKRGRRRVWKRSCEM